MKGYKFMKSMKGLISVNCKFCYGKKEEEIDAVEN